MSSFFAHDNIHEMLSKLAVDANCVKCKDGLDGLIVVPELILELACRVHNHIVSQFQPQ